MRNISWYRLIRPTGNNGNCNYALPPCSMYSLRRVVGAFPSWAKYHKSKYQLLIHLVVSSRQKKKEISIIFIYFPLSQV
ncbi:hypothetical protein IscW_ISCW021406 [Ixodes scapularis]|uniref:Uncharacterized protein n=1 Tax=Ixodes scapularis TaxID=6945 RepID=B7Q675_IXOSC|nr:hypothetical protein IscW_ISCW021406 [Ixodes scapularis]|eukprot:XP_002411923.1 hypothetical protein IscW_ISCW021406 [Ixodes scapularis]